MIKIKDERKKNIPLKDDEDLIEEEETEVIDDEEIPQEQEQEQEEEKASAAPKPAENKEAAGKASAEYQALNDKYLRLCAEYDNFRKRTQREKEALYTDSKANIVREFLPVYDDLERALKAQTADEAYRKGVEMIMSQFEKTLEKLAVKEIPAQGESFNPNLHDAVMHVDDSEAGENQVVDVFQKGFAAGDKVIRPSVVKVAN